ncbi:MAG: hypothetical protein GW949_08180 [Spirochaetales bacterium]|nr:hypothetical protein [Spirochaetales bacterium]
MKRTGLRSPGVILLALILVAQPLWSQEASPEPVEVVVEESVETLIEYDELGIPIMPKIQINQLALGLVLFGSVLTLGGLAITGTSLYQKQAGQSTWTSYAGIGTGMSLGGFITTIIGALNSAPYSRMPVTYP